VCFSAEGYTPIASISCLDVDGGCVKAAHLSWQAFGLTASPASIIKLIISILLPGSITTSPPISFIITALAAFAALALGRARCEDIIGRSLLLQLLLQWALLLLCFLAHCKQSFCPCPCTLAVAGPSLCQALL
jgi:hypothetical protein